MPTQALAYIEWGLEQEHYDSDDPAPTLIEADDLELVAGVLDSEAGSHSTQVVRTVLRTTPLVIATTGPQPHKGLWRHSIRALGDAEGIRLKFSWRVGDGPWTTTEKWVEIPGVDEWYELDAAITGIGVVPEGDHSWEGRIEAVAQSNGDALAIDLVTHMPAERWGRARAPQTSSTATSVDAADGFDQAGGNLHGKTADVGGAWDSNDVGWDAADFAVDDTDHVAQRTATADADVDTGRGAVLGDGTATTLALQLDCKAETRDGHLRQAVLLRYVDPDNWLMVARRTDGFGFAETWLRIYKSIAGAVTVLASREISNPNGSWRTIKATADKDGNVSAWEYPQGEMAGDALTAQDAELASGGDLDSGRFGLYDAWTGLGALTRQYDNLLVSTEETSISQDAVMFPGRSLTILHNTALRENAAGTHSGRVPIYQGQYMRIPPSTRAGKASRLVVKARRLDIAGGQPSQGLDEELTGSLTVTPRVTLTGKDTP